MVTSRPTTATATSTTAGATAGTTEDASHHYGRKAPSSRYFGNARLILIGFVASLVMRPVPIMLMTPAAGQQATTMEDEKKSSALVDCSNNNNNSHSASVAADDEDEDGDNHTTAHDGGSTTMTQRKSYRPRWPQWHDDDDDDSDGTGNVILLRDLIQNGTRMDVDQYDDGTRNRTEIEPDTTRDPKSTAAMTTSYHYNYNGTQKVCESPPKGVATVVTAYYDMASKHPTIQYREWFNKMLQASDPMVVFVDPNSEWKQFVLDRRRHAPTIVVDYPFHNFTMATRFSDTFWKTEVFPRDNEKRFKKGVDVYKIWNEKIVRFTFFCYYVYHV